LKKTKSELLIPCFCAIAIAMIVWSGTFGIHNQLAFASLLGGDTISGQNHLGQLLVNETRDGQTNEQGNTIQKQQDGQEQKSHRNDKAIDAIPKSQSDIVMKDLEDTQLLDRILPIIIKKINLTITQRDTGRIALDPTRYLGMQEVRADCDKNEIVTGGGYRLGDVDAVTTSVKDGNSWLVRVWHPNKDFHPTHTDFGSGITVYVECLKLESK
jgi:hypothetical protein